MTLIYGAEDWSRPEERARNREAIADSEMFTIDQAGHFTAPEKPAEVASLVLNPRVK